MTFTWLFVAKELWETGHLYYAHISLCWVCDKTRHHLDLFDGLSLYWWDWGRAGPLCGEISVFIRANGMFVMLPAGVCSPADLTVCHLDPACTAHHSELTVSPEYEAESGKRSQKYLESLQPVTSHLLHWIK